MKRLWLALLLLTAVFAMHGLQCAAADPSVTASSHAMPGMSSERATSSSTVAGQAAGVVLHAAEAPAAVLGDLLSAPTHPDHPGGSMAHLWTVCLAVLTAVLGVASAVLLVVLRGSRAPASVIARPRRPGQVVAAPAPPDLFTLCVLRN